MTREIAFWKTSPIQRAKQIQGALDNRRFGSVLWQPFRVQPERVQVRPLYVPGPKNSLKLVPEDLESG